MMFLFYLAVALGLVVATSQDTLKAVRKQIEHFTVECDEDQECHLLKNWRYLDGMLPSWPM